MRARAPWAGSGVATEMAPLSRLGAAVIVAAKTCLRIWRHPENRDRRVRALCLYFTWQLWQRGVGRPWTITLVPTRRIRCYPHCVISSGTLYYRLPERGSMRFVLDYLRAGDTMFDVGANVATYALLASTVKGVSVVAFEPASLARERAATNLDLNGVSHRVRLLPFAVGRTNGAATLSTDLGACNRIVRTPTSGSVSPPAGDGAVQAVEMIALDTFVDATAERVDLLKIDVEGLELDVLFGARRVIERDLPALIVEANDPDALTSFLDGLGYSYFAYDPDKRQLRATHPGEHVHRNVIALARPDEAVGRLSERVAEAPCH